ncbi:hypothetical protein [Scytonema sp. NUACC21]
MNQPLVLQEAAILIVKENNSANLSENFLKQVTFSQNSGGWLISTSRPTVFLN